MASQDQDIELLGDLSKPSERAERFEGLDLVMN
jgi:hypothetical protein